MDSELGIKEAASSKQCDICQKTFVRAEHLERHRRIHTKEKPFPCPQCPRSFQRSDVRTLHVKKSHGLVDGQKIPSPTEPRRKRVKVACDLCRRRKMRCDGEQPCYHCRTGGSSCQYNPMAGSVYHTSEQDLMEKSPSRGALSQLDTDVHLHHDNQQPTPLTSPGLSAGTFANPILQQDPVQTSLVLDFEPDWNKPGNCTAFTESSNLSQLDAGFPLDDDLENVLMKDLWEVPVLNGEAWWNDIDLDNDDLIELRPDHTPASSSLQKYSAYMQDYFNQKSRAPSPSPSPNKAATMLYSAPASLVDHDLEILNVYLHLFDRHVPKYFKLFEDSEFAQQTRAEFILAAAAVGGLYCSVEGSFEFTKAMYNDSRRLLLAYTKSSSYYGRIDMTCAEVLIVVKTFILHEIYGLCSGDKRSYEFVEVFHQDLVKALQVLSDLYMSSDDMVGDKEMVHLIEILYILDCYRVVLLQRPPSLLWQHFERISKPAQEQSPCTYLRNLIRSLADPGFSIDTTAVQEFSLATLAGLTPFLWHTIPVAPSDQDSLTTPWKTDFVELAAEKWLRSHHNKIEASSQILYHLLNITMHANLLSVQNYAHSQGGDNSVRGKTRDNSQTFISHWVRGRHFEIAKWHAERLLECAEEALNTDLKEDLDSTRHNRAQQFLARPGRSKSMIDVVHVPYAVYYATIVLWCGATTSDGSKSFTRQSYVTRGRQILAQQKLRIAPLLGRVLRDLKR